ncbi:hypothetical protein T11_7382 [Trichinella zimbabwensis]|uniref:Uncharacterized protein n=1 Tax=Trichinella zimbabwensis TaxID=268475 RepID=A0A0V1HAC0_9BILA|nr:hypothetical protein T11_7382 [Trichinella zimbabwensis]
MRNNHCSATGRTSLTTLILGLYSETSSPSCATEDRELCSSVLLFNPVHVQSALSISTAELCQKVVESIIKQIFDLFSSGGNLTFSVAISTLNTPQNGRVKKISRLVERDQGDLEQNLQLSTEHLGAVCCESRQARSEMFDRVGEEQADVHAAEDAEDEEERGQHGRNARLGRLHRTWYAHHQQAGKVSGCERQQRVHCHVEPVVANQYRQGPLLGQQVAEHEERYEEHARQDRQREPTVTQWEMHPSAGEVSEQGEQVERQKAAHS